MIGGLLLENGVRDPEAIPELSRLLLAQDVRIRRAAASALRHTAASDATAGLVRVLSDSDSRVRYTAVIGLAEITGQYNWGPSIDLFEREGGRYLAHWKEWGRTRH